MIRTYHPHHGDAVACQDALEAIARGTLRATPEERRALDSVLSAYLSRIDVEQRVILRAHDVIHRMRGGS